MDELESPGTFVATLVILLDNHKNHEQCQTSKNNQKHHAHCMLARTQKKVLCSDQAHILEMNCGGSIEVGMQVMDVDDTFDTVNKFFEDANATINLKKHEANLEKNVGSSKAAIGPKDRNVVVGHLLACQV